MPNKPLFSIIMPTHERGEVFWQSLSAANAAIEGMDAEIIVVNDSKKSKIILRESMPQVTVVDNPKSGVASARNYGAILANADLLFFVDDDMLINKKAVLYTLELYKDNYERCYNSDWVYPPELDEKIAKTQFGRYLTRYGFTTMRGWNLGVEWNTEKAFEVDIVMSNFLPIYKSSFNKIKGYNEDFPHSGAEDHDFAKRLKKSGIIAMIDPKLIVYHNEADRTIMEDWLNRKIRSGQTRKMAVDLGYVETIIVHNKLKSAIYLTVIKTKFIFKFILKLIPNIKAFDPIYFKFVNLLLAASLYEGYRR